MVIYGLKIRELFYTYKVVFLFVKLKSWGIIYSDILAYFGFRNLYLKIRLWSEII